MPELPEVETTRLGIAPHITSRCIQDVTIRQPRLRWPITEGFADSVRGQVIDLVQRRGKYLLIKLGSGHIMIHLGMSGSLRILTEADAANVGKHDHVDLIFDHGQVLRFTDPRRFGSIFWIEGDPLEHALLKHFGTRAVIRSLRW